MQIIFNIGRINITDAYHNVFGLTSTHEKSHDGLSSSWLFHRLLYSIESTYQPQTRTMLSCAS